MLPRVRNISASMVDSSGVLLSPVTARMACCLFSSHSPKIRVYVIATKVADLPELRAGRKFVSRVNIPEPRKKRSFSFSDTGSELQRSGNLPG